MNPDDPEIQLAQYQNDFYGQVQKLLNSKECSDEHKRKLLGRYPFPTLLITIQGVSIQVHGAVITGTYAGAVSTRSQFLSDKITFIQPRCSEEAAVKLARLLYGVYEAARLLWDFYKTPPSTRLSMTKLPYHPLPHFTLQNFITEPELVAAGKLLWRGEWKSTGRQVIVKYSERYGVTVGTSVLS